MRQQAHDVQFLDGIEVSVMGFAICTVAGKQTQHGLYTISPFQTTGGAAVGVGWDFGIVLAVSCQTHNVIPVKIP